MVYAEKMTAVTVLLFVFIFMIISQLFIYYNTFYKKI